MHLSFQPLAKTLSYLLISQAIMSQKQQFHHNNNKPTPPAEDWAPAYTNLNNRFFKHLFYALNSSQILPTDGAAEVYNLNPYLWPISPYKFTRFFQQAISFMSTSSEDEYTFLSSLPSLASQILNPSTQSLQDTIFGKECEPPLIPTTSSPSPSQPSLHQLSPHLSLNLSLQK